MEEKDMLLATVGSLNATISSMSETIKSQAATNAALETRIKELTAQVAYLNRQLFGRKSEKLQQYDPRQLELFADEFGAEKSAADAARDEAAEKIGRIDVADRKRERRNRMMMEDLPVLKREIIEPDGLDLSKHKLIGEEVTRIVEHEPGKLYIREIVRRKYGLINPTEPVKRGQGVLIAPMPLLPIYKGIAGPSLLADILLRKYEYHMPFYRQIREFAHLGMKGLTESTVDGWFGQAVNLLRPLYDALKRETMKSHYCQADETTTPVMDRERHKAAKEYLWMVRAVEERLVYFHYDNGSRAGAVIEGLSESYNFRGYLQCDGFVGYESAFKTSSDVAIVSCMAHIRRKFEYALDENRTAAEHILSQIQLLYRIEHACDKEGLSPDERRAKRQELARPIMDAMQKWMETEGVRYSQSSLVGKAVTYAYTRWDNMRHYLEDGRIKIDNNLAENEIRPITLGRKNYLFCGNHHAAENMAVICSLLATCRNHDVNPRDYLNRVLSEMPYMEKATHEQLVELLPHRLKQKATNGL